MTSRSKFIQAGALLAVMLLAGKAFAQPHVGPTTSYDEKNWTGSNATSNAWQNDARSGSQRAGVGSMVNNPRDQW